MNEESYIARREAEQIAFVDSYFNARPQLMRTISQERMVESGFKAGYDAAYALALKEQKK